MNDLKQELKELIIKSLNLEDITPEDINNEDLLFGEGLGLDSIDALELGIAIQKKFNVKINSKSENVKEHFTSVSSLAKFINENQNTGAQ